MLVEVGGGGPRVLTLRRGCQGSGSWGWLRSKAYLLSPLCGFGGVPFPESGFFFSRQSSGLLLFVPGREAAAFCPQG